MGKVKESIVQYGQTTSFKGVSKAVKTSRLSLRILWLFAFCIGGAAGIYQVTTLLIKYYSYSTYTSIDMCNGCHPPFPDVTLCNLNPINLLDEFHGDVLQLDQYLNYIRSLVEVNNTEEVFGTSDIKVLRDVYGWVYSLQGYFQNINTLDVLGILANSGFNKTLVQDCTWYDWNNREYDSEQCRTQSRYFYFTDEFFMCTTLHLNDSNIDSRTDQVKAVQALLFLDDFVEEIMPLYSPHILRSEAKGVRVYIHQANTLPEVGQGFNIPPGYEVKLALKANKITFEPEPYSDCLAEQQPLETGALHESVKQFERWLITYNYSNTAAASICKQEKLIELCGCYTQSLPFTFKMANKYPNVTGCNDIGIYDVVIDGKDPDTIDLKEVINNIQCMSENIDIGSLDQECAQRHECIEYQYDHQVYQSPWPHESYVLPFYCGAIRIPGCDEETYDFEGTPLNEAFSAYEEVLEVAYINITLAWQKLRSLDLISRNFIDLKITYDHPQMVEYTEKPSLTIDQLFGSLGGLFNLWIGITFFTLVELIDLVFVITSQSCQCCAKENPDNTLENTEEKKDLGKVETQDSSAKVQVPDSNGKNPVLEDMKSLPRVQ